MSPGHERIPWLRCAVAAISLVVLTASPVSAQTNGDPAAGREVFEANCAMCHGQDASGMMGMHPSLRGAVERLSFEGVAVTIRKGRDTNPPMPAFEGRLGDQEIERLRSCRSATPEARSIATSSTRSGSIFGYEWIGGHG